MVAALLTTLFVLADGKPEVVVAAQVVDLTGKPIPGAAIRMRVIHHFVQGDFEVRKGGFHTFALQRSKAVTDADGRWKSPPLPGGAGYCVEATAQGFVGDFSRWVHPEEKGTVELPPIKLRRLTTIRGYVVDRAGKPVGDVRVFSNGDGPALRETHSDDRGAFALAGVPEGRLILFADKAGYYFTGALTSSTERPKLVLAPRSAPNPERFPPQPPAKPLPIDPAALAERRRVAIEHAEKVFASKKDAQKNVVGSSLASHAPDYLLRLARRTIYEHEYGRDASIYQVAYSLASKKNRLDSLEAEIIASEVSSGYLDSVLSSLEFYTNDSAKKYEYFSRRAMEARERPEALARVAALSNLAGQMAQKGFAKEAEVLLREAEEIAEKLPNTTTNENIWFSVAEGWARIDPEKVRALAPRVKIVHERLAAAVARRDPKLAAKIYDDHAKSVAKPSSGHWLPELCYELAKTDLPTAERFADNILLHRDRFEPSWRSDLPQLPSYLWLVWEWTQANVGPALKRAVVQGFFADARRVAGDVDGAKRLLADAVSRLERIDGEAWHKSSGFLWTPSACLAALLPLAERIDESLVPELLWRTLAKRPALDPWDSYNLNAHLIAFGDMSAVLVRYRHDLARHVTESLADRAWKQSWRGMSGFWIHFSYYEIDPASARRWCESLCPAPNPFSNDSVPRSPRESAKAYLPAVETDPKKAARPSLKGWKRLLSTLWLERIVDRNLYGDE